MSCQICWDDFLEPQPGDMNYPSYSWNKSVCSLITSCLTLCESQDKEEKHMTIMHTQPQTAWAPQPCGFPSWRKGSRRTLAAPRALPHRAQCAKTIPPQITSEKASKTHLNLISHFPGSWEQDLSGDTTQPSAIVLSRGLPSEGAGAHRTLWHHCPRRKFCSGKQHHGGQLGTPGRSSCRD